jgi:DNA repair photolyase
MPIIYKPRGRAKEYAPLAANIYEGCTHGCRYCFVPTIPGKRDLTMLECNPREKVLEKITKDAEKMKGSDELILLCFTCDPFPAIEERSLTSDVLRVLAENDLNVTVLTKGGMRAIADIPLLAERGWWFGSTMFALHHKYEQKMWEPKAAPLHDRQMAIRFAAQKEVNTWISLEPALSLSGSLELINGISEFVDHWKIGKLNHSKDLPHELQVVAQNMDWGEYVHTVEHALMEQGYMEINEPGVLEPGTYYIKNDLRKYRV